MSESDAGPTKKSPWLKPDAVAKLVIAASVAVASVFYVTRPGYETQLPDGDLYEPITCIDNEVSSGYGSVMHTSCYIYNHTTGLVRMHYRNHNGSDKWTDDF